MGVDQIVAWALIAFHITTLAVAFIIVERRDNAEREGRR